MLLNSAIITLRTDWQVHFGKSQRQSESQKQILKQRCGFEQESKSRIRLLSPWFRAAEVFQSGRIVTY